ncbi:hypothetical protein [Acinetobacter bereziniae]|uniref:hypothetical protein n=1 Tax=Acinetobacter bereziniae TaxID=106648 RepID=UPI00124CB1BB|nr:hypothetical protein [Acinetobacter bereziniae]
MKKYLLIGMLFFSCATNAIDYKAALNGKKLVMSNASCAGISLKKDSGLSGEIGNTQSCKVDMPARLRWLNDNTFMLVEKNQTNEKSPPRVFLYQVKKIQGNKVVLSEIWTGWNNLPDDETTYTIQ